MQQTKKIRKMGAVLCHREVGFKANVLVAWEVPESRLDEIARHMAASPSVTHCYDRNTAPGWPYNLYTMVHGHSREECEQVVKALGRECNVSNHVMLYSKHEWKKTAMRYFMENE
jgi:DNA-binding Lrp family transcriptional regulator